MKITILGSGGSTGVPVIGKGWGACDPKNPKNRRMRPSILVENGATTVLVDTSPDLRQQLLNAQVSRLDGVLFTHYHADHLHGIDDLRPINRAMEQAIDVYADADTMAQIGKRFGYVLEPLAEGATFYYKPTLNAHHITPGDHLSIGDMDIDVFEQDHGICKTMGFRFGSMAYSTDVVELDEKAFEALAGVETWIIGTLFDRPHQTHAHVDKALDWIDIIQPRRAFLTHLGPDLDYDTLNARLPETVRLAFDGLVIED